MSAAWRRQVTAKLPEFPVRILPFLDRFDQGCARFRAPFAQRSAFLRSYRALWWPLVRRSPIGLSTPAASVMP